MTDKVECFWLEPTETGRLELRRYENYSGEEMEPAPTCPGNRTRFHDTSVFIGDVPYPFEPANLLGYGRDDVPHDDRRWPVVCHVCGTPFRENDHWQHNVNRLFSGAPDGKLYTTRNMPPGAMYDAKWWPQQGPDGIALVVVLPPNGGDDYWMPDGPAKGGGAWTRTGTVPKVTCTPSILTPRYHGFLTDGFLISC